MIRIRVWLVDEDYGRVLKPMFDPPPSSWRFRETYPLVDMRQMLENELADVSASFVGYHRTDQKVKALTIAIQNVLHRWQSNGWLIVDSEYERL